MIMFRGTPSSKRVTSRGNYGMESSDQMKDMTQSFGMDLAHMVLDMFSHEKVVKAMGRHPVSNHSPRAVVWKTPAMRRQMLQQHGSSAMKILPSSIMTPRKNVRPSVIRVRHPGHGKRSNAVEEAQVNGHGTILTIPRKTGRDAVLRDLRCFKGGVVSKRSIKRSRILKPPSHELAKEVSCSPPRVKGRAPFDSYESFLEKVRSLTDKDSRPAPKIGNNSVLFRSMLNGDKKKRGDEFCTSEHLKSIFSRAEMMFQDPQPTFRPPKIAEHTQHVFQVQHSQSNALADLRKTPGIGDHMLQSTGFQAAEDVDESTAAESQPRSSSGFRFEEPRPDECQVIPAGYTSTYFPSDTTFPFIAPQDHVTDGYGAGQLFNFKEMSTHSSDQPSELPPFIQAQRVQNSQPAAASGGRGFPFGLRPVVPRSQPLPPPRSLGEGGSDDSSVEASVGLRFVMASTHPKHKNPSNFVFRPVKPDPEEE